MGNEFGHPEWLDFPREGNGWSYHYCRRQWSLVDNPELKYGWLAEFDRQLMDFAKRTNLLAAPPAQNLYIDNGQKIIVAERANLIFVFNFSTSNSIFGYPVHVPGLETRELMLDSDQADTGGHGRIDHAFDYPVTEHGVMQIYTPSRTGLVYAKK
jgi:1,4-alpha-glucan branching enzyme